MEISGIAKYDGNGRLGLDAHLIKKAHIEGRCSYVVSIINDCLILIPKSHYMGDKSVLENFDRFIKQNLSADDELLRKFIFKK